VTVRARPVLESLEDKILPSVLMNGDFSDGLNHWSIPGDEDIQEVGGVVQGDPDSVKIDDPGRATLHESMFATETDLFQSFDIPTGASRLTFILDGTAADSNPEETNGTPDAFGVSLLDPTALTPLLATVTDTTDSYYIKDLVNGVTDGLAAAGVVVSPGPADESGSVQVSLDVRTLGGQSARLLFRVIGGNDFFSESSATISQVAVTMLQAPAITSDSSTTFTVGTAGSFTVTATGDPPPTLSEAGGDTLPAGVTFHPDTGLLSGTPQTGTAGNYTLHFTAANGVNPDYTQVFTLTVSAAQVAPPVPSTPDLTDASDSGSSHTDNITNVTTPTFTGTAQAGTTVTVYDGTTSLGTTPAGTDGSWTFVVPAASALSDGTHSITATATNSGGHTSAPSSALSVLIDTTAPTITAARDGTTYAAAHSGWNNTNVTVSYSASDNTGGSGLVSPATGSQVVSSEGANQSVTFSVADVAGNSSSATVSGIKIDKTAPTVSESINSPAGTGWYNIATGPAVITYTASDALSGVTTPASFTFSDGVSLSHAGITVTDVAGNTSAATAGFSGIKQDTVAPTVSESINSPAATGWYNSATGPAVITYTASDATSGVTTPAPFTFSDGANQSHAGVTVTDAAGNFSAATAGFSGIKQDTVAPTVSESITSPASTGWYNIASGPAVITYTAFDATSGVVTPAPYTFSDGANQSHAGVTVTDAAGNTSAATAGFSGIKQDTVAPTVSESITSPASTGWYNIASGPAVITYTASDATSGVTTPAPFTFSDGANQSHAGVTVTDAAGNTSAATAGFSGIKQDTVAPTVSESINSPAATGWYNIATGPAVIAYTASDATSGVTTPAPFTFSDGANQSHAGITVTDAAGNTSAATAGFSGIKQDTVAPTVTESISSPASTGWYNIASGPAVITYTAFDATSGVTTPAPYTFGDGTNLSHAGVTVTDAAGNTSATTAGFSGIKQDTVAPTVSESINSPGSTGWYNIASGPAVITYTASDATSGVTAPAAFTFSDGTNQSHAGVTVTDAAGNTSAATAGFSGIKQDIVAPTVSESINSPAATGWYNIATGPAVITYTASDATSGVTTPAPFTFSDGANQSHAGVTVTDAAGNTSAATAGFSGIKQDTVAPTVSESITSPAGTGWYNIATGPAVITYTASDATSGVTTPAPFTFSDGTNQSHAGVTVTDAAGNTSAATAGFSGIRQDTVAPTVSESITSPASTGWYNIASGPAVITYTASDATSGVTAPAPFTFSDGANLSHAGITVTDAAGNTSAATAGFSGIKQDTVAPTISASLDRNPAATGWYNISTGAPTATFSGTDAGGSGVASVTSPHLFGEGAHLSASGTVTDVAGNSTTASFFDLSIDLTSPTITAQRDTAANSNGWNNTDVHSSYAASDALSGLASPATGTFTFTAEGAGQSHTFTVTDAAGNSSSATVSGVNIDKTAPTSQVYSPHFTAATTIAVGYTDSDPLANNSASGVARVDLFARGPADSAYAQVDTVANPGATGSFTYTATEGDGNYSFYTVATDNAGNVQVNAAAGAVSTVTITASIYVLNAQVSGALSLSGNASLSAAGGVAVDSASNSALTLSGNAQLSASPIQVVGGYSKSGNATWSVTPTHVAAFADPLAGLPAPDVTGLTNYGSVNLSGKDTRTICPGVYSRISVSGNAKLTLNPGVYVIAGGGFTLSGKASVTGSEVMIFNAGCNYANGGAAGGSYGGISLSGTGQAQLTAPTSGTYAGVLIFQPADNTRALSLSGNAPLATGALNGTVYAPSALLAITGNAQLRTMSLVVNRLTVSGNGSNSVAIDGSTSSSVAAGELLAGDLTVFVNDAAGALSADERARIDDAVAGLNGLLAPYSVTVTEVGADDSDLANVVLDTGDSSAVGGYADGVLGCYTTAGEITLIRGWDWYAGADAAQVGAGQYDFQTIVTHELGHALGLGHSDDVSSVMHGTLAAGVAHRTMTARDLNIPDADGGADGLHAAPPPSATTSLPSPAGLSRGPTAVQSGAGTVAAFALAEVSARPGPEPAAPSPLAPGQDLQAAPAPTPAVAVSRLSVGTYLSVPGGGSIADPGLAEGLSGQDALDPASAKLILGNDDAANDTSQD
jgi:CRISPR/Cas system type I-B associated protein Csh2 (Cas7 group RAMP superfamily)